VLVLAADAGARPLRQVGSGLNAALAQARSDAVARSATALLVLPSDLPLVSAEALGAFSAIASAAGSPTVALAADRHGRGTNALLLVPPEAIDFAFGGDSRSAHAALASAAGARYLEVEGPLALDLDTPEDLLVGESALGARA
jgi:2-phospho-L-lactate guanylyltransferase